MSRDFPYHALRDANDSIRVLTLLPKLWNTCIDRPACLLHHVRLSNRPLYTALSYVWGDESIRRVIFVNGREVSVAKNLFDALAALRYKNKCRIIWVDALCINQCDLEEKSSQVALMSRIYWRSSRAIGWLGLADETSDVTIDYLNELGPAAERCLLLGPKVLLHYWSKATENLRTTTSPYRVSDSPATALLAKIIGFHGPQSMLPLDGMAAFFTRSWWTRIWILQEITLPSEMALLCGNKSIPRKLCAASLNIYSVLWQVVMRELSTGIRALSPYHLKMALGFSFQQPRVMLSSRKVYCEEGGLRLAGLLRATCLGSINIARHGPHDFHSTKPEDKIYALLGIANDRNELEQKGLVLDYERSYQDIYTSAMAAFLEQGHLSVLNQCQTYALREDLPSWVPDWSLAITDSLQDVEDDHVTVYPAFNTSNTPPNRSGLRLRRERGHVEALLLQGQIYDVVRGTGYFPYRITSHEVPLGETRSWPITWLLECLRLSYQADGQYDSFEHRMRTIARTCVGGIGIIGTQVFTKLREERFEDAVVLLNQALAQGYDSSYSEAHGFLKGNKARGIINNNSYEVRSLDVPLASNIIGRSLGRLPFVTRKGHLGLSTEHVQVGDKIAIIKGSQTPYILRTRGNGKYCLVGEAYIDRIMEGEVARHAIWRTIEVV